MPVQLLYLHSLCETGGSWLVYSLFVAGPTGPQILQE